MKKGWDRYALEKRYIKKGYLRKYRNGNPVWKAQSSSGGDCLQQGGEIEEKEIKGEQNEERREKEGFKTPEGRQEGIQGTDQRRSEIDEIPEVSKEKRKIKARKKKSK